jgi:hypothetical protein
VVLGFMAQMEKTTIPKWHFKSDYVETCNCDYGCPCNFNGFLTYGFCRALVFFHIRSGNYSNIKLDALDVIYAASWPKAIHEGNGTMQLFISKNATNEQRDALIKIFSGEAKGEGPFAIFKDALRYILDPQFVDIIAKIDGKKSSFYVRNKIDVEVESFRNPVTGEEQETEIRLPKGFIWKIGHAAKTKLMRISTPHLNFNDSGQNAIMSVVEYEGP